MRVLGLDLGERELRVARGERVLGAVRLLGIERIPIDDPAALPALATGRRTLVRSALPAALATHRTLVLPFADRRRLAETVPLELAGQLGVDAADEAIAFTPLGGTDGGTAVLAVAARRDDVAAHRALLAAAGLAAAHVDLAPLPVWSLVPPAAGDVGLVLADGERSALSVRRDGRLAGLRALGARGTDAAALAAEVRWSLAALGGTPARVIVAGADAGPAMLAALGAALRTEVLALTDVVELPGITPDALAAGALAAGLALGAGRGAHVGVALAGDASQGASLLRVGALAAAAVALVVLDVGLVRHGLARRDATLAAAIRAEAAAVLPDAPLVAPRAELEAALAAAGRRRARLGGASALAVLRELSTRLPEALRLDLDEVAVEPEVIRVHGRTDGFDAVDALRRALAASPLLTEVRADETRTTVDGRQVEFRLTATRRSVPGVHS